jgi:hypothetical protein
MLPFDACVLWAIARSVSTQSSPFHSGTMPPVPPGLWPPLSPHPPRAVGSHSSTVARGVAEPTDVSTAAATANAFCNATGERIQTLPLTPADVLALVMPMIAGADDHGWMPPEWTPTPPAWPPVDLVQLVQLLEAKGVVSDEEYAQLTQPGLSLPFRQGQARVWTWDEIDRNPVRSTP